MTTMTDKAVTQYRGMFRTMAATGGAYHLYRAPGTDNVALMHEAAQWDVPQWPVFVPNVHALTERQLVAKLQSAVTR